MCFPTSVSLSLRYFFLHRVYLLVRVTFPPAEGINHGRSFVSSSEIGLQVSRPPNFTVVKDSLLLRLRSTCDFTDFQRKLSFGSFIFLLPSRLWKWHARFEDWRTDQLVSWWKILNGSVTMFYGRYNTWWILTQIHIFPMSRMEITKLCHGLSIGKSVVPYHGFFIYRISARECENVAQYLGHRTTLYTLLLKYCTHNMPLYTKSGIMRQVR